MMCKAALIACVLVASISAAYGLNCYSYAGLSSTDLGTTTTCVSGSAGCMKYTVTLVGISTYYRLCAAVSSCSVLSVTGVGSCNMCTTDNCNSAGLATMNLRVLIGACALVLLALRVRSL